MTAILYQRPDGGVSIMYPTPWSEARGPCVDRFLEWCAAKGLPTDAADDVMEKQWLDHVVEKDVPKDAVAIKACARSEIPEDRTFRHALTMDLTHDMTKAREIWRAKIRAERAPKLAALDVAYQRADERADTAAKADIVKAKQALRDATADPAIEQATTCAELKAVRPAALKG